MPAETIESFVAKLQAEGVEAGKQAAEKLIEDARKQAEQILADAEAQKRKIIAAAEAQAAGIRNRSQTELELAARDTVLKLRDCLSGALSALLAQAVEKKLSDVEFLGTILHELVMLYAAHDRDRESQIRIDVCPELREKLIQWVLGELGHDFGSGAHPSIDLKGRLSQAGFEYEVSGATTEVTVDSVVEVLSELVSPALRELLEKAVAERKTRG